VNDEQSGLPLRAQAQVDLVEASLLREILQDGAQLRRQRFRLLIGQRIRRRSLPVEVEQVEIRAVVHLLAAQAPQSDHGEPGRRSAPLRKERRHSKLQPRLDAGVGEMRQLRGELDRGDPQAQIPRCDAEQLPFAIAA